MGRIKVLALGCRSHRMNIYIYIYFEREGRMDGEQTYLTLERG